MAKGLFLICSEQRTVGGFTAGLKPLDLVPKACLCIWIKNRPSVARVEAIAGVPAGQVVIRKKVRFTPVD